MTSMHFERRAVTRAVSVLFAAALPIVALADNGQGASGNTDSSYAQGRNSQGATSANHSTAVTDPRGNSYSNVAGQSSNDVSNDRNVDELWRRIDTNNDGQISRAEFDAYHRANSTRGNDSTQASTGLEHQMRASDLIGMDVRNRSGENLGQIKDLIVDTGSGKVKSAILSFGGVLGVGDKLFRYPLSSFSRDASDALVLNVDDQTLKSAKGFDRNDWTERKQPNVWQASRLLGKDVVDRNGEHLGEIQDLAIDTQSGKIDYAVLKYDRPWSLDNPLVAMPLNSFNFGDGRHDVSMNVDRAQIDAQASSGSNAEWNEPNGRVVTERWIFLLPSTASSADNRSQPQSAAANRKGNTGSAPQSDTTSSTADRSVSSTSDLNASPDANDRSQRTSAVSGSTTSPAAANDATSATSNGPDRSSMAPSTATTTQFDRLDANHDGRLDRQEFESGSGTATDFSNTDRNNDQNVTREEFANHPNSMPH